MEEPRLRPCPRCGGETEWVGTKKLSARVIAGVMVTTARVRCLCCKTTFTGFMAARVRRTATLEEIPAITVSALSQTMIGIAPTVGHLWTAATARLIAGLGNSARV